MFDTFGTVVTLLGCDTFGSGHIWNGNYRFSNVQSIVHRFPLPISHKTDFDFFAPKMTKSNILASEHGTFGSAGREGN